MRNSISQARSHKFLWFLLGAALLVLELGSWWTYRKHVHELIGNIVQFDYEHKNWSLQSRYEQMPIVSDTIKIDLSEIAFQSLAQEWNTNYKNLHRIDNSPWIDKKQKHPARVKYLYGGQSFWQKAEISIVGMLADHHSDFERMSLKINLKGDNRLLGKKSFSLLLPETRQYFVDQLANEVFAQSRQGLQLQTRPIWVKFRKNPAVMMLLEDKLDKFLIESNQRRESILFEKGFQGDLRDIPGIELKSLDWSCNATLKDSARQSQLHQWVSYTFNKDTNQLFQQVDHQKVMSVWAIGMLCQSWHHWVDINMHWYYNPVNHLFEPSIREVNVDPQWRFTGTLHRYDNRKKNYQQYVRKLQQEIVMGRPNFLVSYASWGEKNIPDFWQKLDAEVSRSATILRKKLPKFKQASMPLSSTNLKDYQRIYQEIESYLPLFEFEPETVDMPRVAPKIIQGAYTITGFHKQEQQPIIIKAGSTIRFKGPQAIWVMKHGVYFAGTASNPIYVVADSQCRASIFIETTDSVRFEHVHVQGLSNLQWGPWKTPSAITINQTNKVVIDHCEFSQNRSGDDYLNLFRCEDFQITHCQFQDVLSDALDSDFSSGRVSHTLFNRIGNDGIDGSGSRIDISDCVFQKLKDKAISSGEKSHFTVNRSRITDSEIGLVSKDQSTLTAKTTEMEKVRLPVAVFQKKPEYGSASLTIDTDINTSYYLIENGSQIEHTGGSIDTEDNVKEKLYGNEYGSATKK